MSGGIVSSESLITVLGDYEATIAEASHVFNFGAINFDDDSHLVLVIDGSVTAALALQIRINADATSNYSSDGRRITANVVTPIDLGPTTQHQIGSTTLLPGVNVPIFCIVNIGLNKAGTLDRPKMFSTAVAGNIQEQMAGILAVSNSDITDVEVRTSTSTWQIGTRMTLYSVRR